MNERIEIYLPPLLEIVEIAPSKGFADTDNPVLENPTTDSEQVW